jgi:polysaccharide transporter, PST family
VKAGDSSGSRRLLTGAAGYTTERAVRLLLSAVVGVLVARYLGPTGLGLLNYATALFGLLGPVVLLGMEPILVRELSTADDRRSLLASALVRQTPVAVIASIVGPAILVASRGTSHEVVTVAAAMVPVPYLAMGGTIRSYLEATGQVRRIVITGLLAAAVTALVKLAAILLRAPLWVFAFAATVEAAVIALGLAGGVPGRKRLARVRRAARTHISRQLVAEAWPLLLAGVAVTVYMSADVVMLGLLTDDRETGIYVAAARLSEVWYFLPMSALAAVRPRLANLFAKGEMVRYRTWIQRYATSAFVASIAAVLLIQVYGEWLIAVLYGPRFLEAADVLRIHILAAPFVFLGVAGSQWFIDHRMTSWVMRRSIIGAVVNVVLNLILVPPYGAMGAAVATLIAYALSGVLLNGLTRQGRDIFWIQIGAARLAWRRSLPGEPTDEHQRSVGHEDEG